MRRIMCWSYQTRPELRLSANMFGNFASWHTVWQMSRTSCTKPRSPSLDWATLLRKDLRTDCRLFPRDRAVHRNRKMASSRAAEEGRDVGARGLRRCWLRESVLKRLQEKIEQLQILRGSFAGQTTECSNWILSFKICWSWLINSCLSPTWTAPLPSCALQIEANVSGWTAVPLTMATRACSLDTEL